MCVAKKIETAACVPQCAIAFEKLWLEAGAAAGAYTNLLISHHQVNRVIDDPRIKGVALTGSVEAGSDLFPRKRPWCNCWTKSNELSPKGPPL